jgi:hypothetical protein
MRTLKLSHEQIQLIEQALKIAEKECIDLSQRMIKMDYDGKTMYDKSCDFYDLKMEIVNGKADV